MPALIFRGPAYFSPGDERSMFDWLGRIGSVSKITGRGRELIVLVRRASIPDKDLREFLALFRRYRLDMTQLAQFENARNRTWFADEPQAFWHKQVFRQGT
jgi:hypothetical protein